MVFGSLERQAIFIQRIINQLNTHFMPEELRPRNYDNGPMEAPMEAVNEARVPELTEKFDHLTSEQLKKRWNITIEPLDRGCIVQIGCKRIAFEDYGNALASINQFYSKPHDTVKQWRDILGV